MTVAALDEIMTSTRRSDSAFPKENPPMPSDHRPPKVDGTDLIELTRVQPFEAEVIAARLRASGIEAILGTDTVYESFSFAEGVPVLVSTDDAPRALALLEESATPE
jgi:hypothetical protein